MIMWKEELGIIIQEGGIHEIEYKLQNNEVIAFMVRNVSYYGQYCIVADSCTHSKKSYWMERKFTISKIKSIDNVPYDQSIAHLNYLRKCDEEKEYRKSTFDREQPVGERREKPYGNTSRSSKPKPWDRLT